MLKTELTGNALKKGLNAHSVSMRWHNRNKQGGNFGFNIYFGKEFNRETNRELTGFYNKDGVVYSLSFSGLYQAGGKLEYHIKPTARDANNPLKDVLRKIDYNDFSVNELIEELKIRGEQNAR